MRRSGIGFDERRSRNVLTEQVVVVIVKTRNIQIGFLAQKLTVSEVVPVELFRSEIIVGIEARKERRAVRCGGDEAGEKEVFFCSRWCP